MTNREEVLEFFRSDSINDLDTSDRYEIMMACCSQSDFLEGLINKAIDEEEGRLERNE